jgi:hypothetical protein
MNDRPRPQYGEYASPEEQFRAIAVPAPGNAHAPAQPGQTAQPRYTDQPSETARPSQARPSQLVAARPRQWDRVLSVGLLAYGLANVVSGFFQFSDLSALLTQLYAVQGIGKFTPTPLASALGIVINVSSAVIWVLALVFTVWMLRRRKLAFYLPIIGGVLASIVTAICVAVLSFSDPAFLSYLAANGG